VVPVEAGMSIDAVMPVEAYGRRPRLGDHRRNQDRLRRAPGSAE